MPAAVPEAAGRVLVGGAGRLDDPVEGHPLVHDHLAHLVSFRSVFVSALVCTSDPVESRRVPPRLERDQPAGAHCDKLERRCAGRDR
jgi:hypothetical protein